MPDWFSYKMINSEAITYNCDYRRFTIDEAYCVIRTLEGDMVANGGDYIIQGVNGEIYPCNPEIFEKTYEAVEGVEINWLNN
ncbi:hypothetical protein [Marinococcus halophilus]